MTEKNTELAGADREVNQEKEIGLELGIEVEVEIEVGVGDDEKKKRRDDVITRDQDPDRKNLLKDVTVIINITNIRNITRVINMKIMILIETRQDHQKVEVDESAVMNEVMMNELSANHYLNCFYFYFCSYDFNICSNFFCFSKKKNSSTKIL